MNRHPETPGSPAGRRSRRDILRTAVVAGGGLWSAGVITPLSRAFANGVTCTDADCLGTAFSFSQDVDPAFPSTLPAAPASVCPGDCFPDLDVNQPAPTAAHPLSARSGAFCACHAFLDGTGACRSEASVENVVIWLHRRLFRNAETGMPGPHDFVIEADLLASSTQAECDCTVGREGRTVNVRIKEPRTGAFLTFGNAEPNQFIVFSRVTYPGFRIIANEQRVRPDGLCYTAALHVILPDDVPPQFGRHIYLGYSAVRQAACSPCPSGPPSSGVILFPIP